MSAEPGPKTKVWSCPFCCCVFQNGWKRYGHGKTCYETANITHNEEHPETSASETMGPSAANTVDAISQRNAAEATVAEQDLFENLTYTDEGAIFEETYPDSSSDKYVGNAVPFNQHNARNMPIAPKDMEILLLLQCTDESVVGTSREQKQRCLDYVKSFDTHRTRLLPKSIKTCYGRMDKVGYSLCIASTTRYQTACTTSVTITIVHIVHSINVPINVILVLH